MRAGTYLSQLCMHTASTELGITDATYYPEKPTLYLLGREKKEAAYNHTAHQL